MLTILRKLARRWSLWAVSCTRNWVVGPEIYFMIDCGKLDMAAEELDKQELLWQDDPELLYARSLIRLMRDEDHEDST